MRLALLGHPISHSLSPSIYQDLLGSELKSYELLDIADVKDIPELNELSLKLDGLSITAPYKKHFYSQVEIASKNVREIGAINTIAFRDGKYFGTNTDLEATEFILRRFKNLYPSLQLILLGNGSMAKMTKLIAEDLGIPLIQKSRDQGVDLSEIDLARFYTSDKQTIVINSCSRSFIFKGLLHKDYIFWDYNYNFKAHQDAIPSQVMSYYDGQEMLRLQAESALSFFRQK